MLLFALASAAAPMHSQVDALAAANAAAAAATAAAGGAAVAPLAGEQAACPSYTSLTNQPEDDAINDWCQVQCPAFCPEDKCVCISDAPKRREEPVAVNEPGGAAAAEEADPAEQRKALHTELPRTIPERISGPWFYVTDGNTREPTGHERNSLYGDFDGAGKEIGFGSTAGRKLPDWLASANRSGNAITLAFMNPTELGDAEFGVPPAFIEYTHLLRQGPENRDRQIYFAIGGMEFNGYDFLADMALAEAAGENACGAARAHNVGIEIDHEGTKGNDVEGLKSFVKGFRKKCPMGQYPISMDVMGGPGGGALFWAPEAVKALLPPGKPTDPPPDDGEAYLDFVNIMVIGACQDAACLIQFWKQWEDSGIKDQGSINYERTAFTFTADRICDDAESPMIRDAWEWIKEKNGYGLRAWSVDPHTVNGHGLWKNECNGIGAPGLQAMCAIADAGCEAPSKTGALDGHSRASR
jgi:hypothetical protein